MECLRHLVQIRPPDGRKIEMRPITDAQGRLLDGPIDVFQRLSRKLLVSLHPLLLRMNGSDVILFLISSLC